MTDDYPLLDEQCNPWLWWLRQAGALLVSIVSVFVIASAPGAKDCLAETIGIVTETAVAVSVTELRKSFFPESVAVTNFAPHIHVASPTPEALHLINGKNCGGTLDHFRSGRHDIVPVHRRFIDREIVQAPVAAHLDADVPFDISRRQISDIFKSNAGHGLFTCAERLNTEWLGAQISPLQYFKFPRLADSYAPSDDPQRDGGPRQYGGKANEPKGEISDGVALRFLPDGFVGLSLAIFCSVSIIAFGVVLSVAWWVERK